MGLWSPRIHAAILPVWELQLFYSLWPKPGLPGPGLYVTPASAPLWWLQSSMSQTWRDSLSAVKDSWHLYSNRILESSNPSLSPDRRDPWSPRGHAQGHSVTATPVLSATPPWCKRPHVQGSLVGWPHSWRPQEVKGSPSGLLGEVLLWGLGLSTQTKSMEIWLFYYW